MYCPWQVFKERSVGTQEMKYIVVTGGVISGFGRGIISSSLGVILKSHGLRVSAIKIDPHIRDNVLFIDRGELLSLAESCYIGEGEYKQTNKQTAFMPAHFLPISTVRLRTRAVMCRRNCCGPYWWIDKLKIRKGTWTTSVRTRVTLLPSS